ncbi:MAG: nitrite reductase [Bacteroidetes bacterium]|nr:nitrite reductase [Bacteroidota bacterium]MDA1121176.1 nitrite reductase [Bacteroidota bacterium]
MNLESKEKISSHAKKDIEELEYKINRFYDGKIPDERFRAFRLTRGVYGQRQPGVQMIRIKIPYGKLNGEQLIRIADISDEFTNGILHATTRQNIQIHYIKLDDSPQIWTKLEEVGITLRESCGNTVRNVTGSAMAGIDPDEPFDISPYAETAFQYFLRNAVCQDMGRKVKTAFSSSEKDSAFAYIHDFGFIPMVQSENGVEQRGFKVLLGGGLGAQSIIAKTAYEFLPEDKLIPFMEASLRVFDRYGEREKRHKARMKYLLEGNRSLGLEKFLELVGQEMAGLPYESYPIDLTIVPETKVPEVKKVPEVVITNDAKYQEWRKTNVFEQKQKGFYGIHFKPQLGNISSDSARKLVASIEGFVADDIRVTVNQGFLLRYAREGALPYLFSRLDEIGLAETGFGSIVDITACPGTDTCNLGVTNSTSISVELEKMVRSEFPHLIGDSNINIKISGCMNSCGQHMIANIGFHGSSIKHGDYIVPALQVVIGGGVDLSGKGFIADKVIKLPTKRIPGAVRILLDDYEANSNGAEYFNDYYQRQGKIYFYDLLKPLGDLSTLSPTDYIDWGQSDKYIPEIGVGECAGVSYDMVSTIVGDAEERLQFAGDGLASESFSDSIYNSYSAMVIGAKALLLSKDVACNTHGKIIADFNEHYYKTGEFKLEEDFETLVLQINKNKPTEDFARTYFRVAEDFINQLHKVRSSQVEENSELEGKLVVDKFYKG